MRKSSTRASFCSAGRFGFVFFSFVLLSSVLETYRGETGVNGICGSSCEGKPDIDNIGVYEFDTGTETVVATHLMKEGIGGDPYPSPDGSKSLPMCEENPTRDASIALLLPYLSSRFSLLDLGS